MLRKALLAASVLVLAGCAASAEVPSTYPAAPTAAVPEPPQVAAEPRKDPTAHPVRVEIAKLGVVDDIVPVGFAPNGELEVPSVDRVGWFDESPVPGAVGPSILAGHVNWHGIQGSFARIGELAKDDLVVVTSSDKTKRTFKVYLVVQFAKSRFDKDLVYADRDDAELVLVTCSGTVQDGNYSDNTVVLAREV